ncbi:MAG: NYN domain-containing protein [Planctomycetaceae bacterium]
MHVARFDLLIDGYNLMHAAGFARDQYGPRGLQTQRERFVRWLWKRIPPRLRVKTIVVFDAGQSDGRFVQQESFEDLRLLYSPQGSEADDLIEELIELHSSPKQLQVISSDHRLHKAARKRRATALDSEAFVGLMLRLIREAQERQRQIEEESKPTGELAEETEEWLRVFAEADELLADVQPLIDSSGGGPPETRAQPKPSPALRPPQAEREDEPRAIPASSMADSPTADIAGDELAFWEERLRDLLLPRKDNRSSG